MSRSPRSLNRWQKLDQNRPTDPRNRNPSVSPSGSPGIVATAFFLASLMAVSAANISEAAPLGEEASTNSFPDPGEVLQGRTFANTFDRDVYFLKRIREAYPSEWAPLLRANILVTDYVVDPDKLQKYIREVGEATVETDDFVAATNLAVVVSDPAFYANTNTFRPEILRTASIALLRLGPSGQRALAGAFNEFQYRLRPESLEIIAEAVGQTGASDSKLRSALGTAAFSLSASNGGSYPGCTRKAVIALLQLSGGEALVRQHLNENDVFDDPSRYQDVVEAIVSANAAALRPDLVRMESAAKTRLELLKSSPGTAGSGPYVEELSKFQSQASRAIERLKSPQKP